MSQLWNSPIFCMESSWRFRNKVFWIFPAVSLLLPIFNVDNELISIALDTGLWSDFFLNLKGYLSHMLSATYVLAKLSKNPFFSINWRRLCQYTILIIFFFWIAMVVLIFNGNIYQWEMIELSKIPKIGIKIVPFYIMYTWYFLLRKSRRWVVWKRVPNILKTAVSCSIFNI